MPTYPDEDIRNNVTGVVVVAVRVAHTGHCQSFSVLEAPSETIKAAVASALRGWAFQPWWPDGYVMQSLLTFYFVRKDQTYLVLSPADAGYVGKLGSRDVTANTTTERR